MLPTLSRRGLLRHAIAPAMFRPNIVFILVDDLRWDELGCTGHPFASTPSADRLAREGASFVNAFTVAPLCSPSRASFLTGQYPRTHGIVDNTDRSAQSHKLRTWPAMLRASGYRTAFIGKWHMGNDDSPRPGFDRWVSFRGQGESTNPDLNIDGKPVKAQGYITDILTDHALSFLREKHARPYCLYLSHKAIHPNITQRNDGSISGNPSAAEQFIPAQRHRYLYMGRSIPHRPNYGKPPADKPALEQKIGGLPPLGPQTVTSDQVILNRMRMMKAVDEGLGRILETLEGAGQIDNTMVVLTSDHGYFYGEHGLSAECRLAYEECIRIPLLMRYPRMIRAGERISPFALSVDIAPTMLLAAGVRMPAGMEGRPLAPLFEGVPPKWRDSFLVEYTSDSVFPRIRNMGYDAVRGTGWKFIKYRQLQGMDELYDLKRDPYELKNLALAPEARELAARAQRRLKELMANPRT